MLTVADKAGMGVGDMLTLAEKGVRPLILADKICEQTLLYVPCVGEGVKTGYIAAVPRPFLMQLHL